MSLFGKKPAPAPARPATASPAAAAKPAPIAITAAGVYSHAGNSVRALTAALGLNHGIAVPDKTVAIGSADGKSATQALTARIAGLDSAQINPAERVQLLARDAWMAVASGIPGDGELPVCVAISVPPSGDMRAALFTADLMQSLFDAGTTHRYELKLLPAGAGNVRSLNALCAELAAGKWRALVYGGADSLVDKATLLAWAKSEKLMTEQNIDGVIPGEGAAFVVLQSEAWARETGAAALAWIDQWTEEKESKDALTRAIRAALAGAQIEAAEIDAVISALGTESERLVEWYEVTRSLWPHRISEQQRLAVQLGEIERPDIPDDPTPPVIATPLALGNVGAASLPLALAAGCGAFALDASLRLAGFTPRNRVLAVAGEGGSRTAALLRAPYAASQTGSLPRVATG